MATPTYTAQTFVAGQILKASHMNNIEEGISTLYDVLGDLGDNDTISDAINAIQDTIDTTVDEKLTALETSLGGLTFSVTEAGLLRISYDED